MGAAAILLLGVGIASISGSRPVSNSTAPTVSVAPTPSELPNAKAFLAQAEAARTEGSFFKAKQLYQQILQQFPDAPTASAAQQRLGEVNMKIMLSPAMTPDALTHTVESGDTLSKIARKHHTTVDLLKAANGLTSDRIRPGQRLKIVTASFSVIVDKSQNLLTLKNGEEVLKVYRCSTGKEGMTPTGTFKIANRIPDPPWYTPEGVIPPHDPRNILGSRWLGFDQPGYGIHGTTQPDSIGKPVTKGCVRLVNSDVEELYTLLPEGTAVTIVE